MKILELLQNAFRDCFENNYIYNMSVSLSNKLTPFFNHKRFRILTCILHCKNNLFWLCCRGVINISCLIDESKHVLCLLGCHVSDKDSDSSLSELMELDSDFNITGSSDASIQDELGGQAEEVSPVFASPAGLPLMQLDR